MGVKLVLSVDKGTILGMARLEDSKPLGSAKSIWDRADNFTADFLKRYLPPLYVMTKWFVDYMSRNGASTSERPRYFYYTIAILITFFLLYQFLSGLL